jgi:hypothetical protein
MFFLDSKQGHKSKLLVPNYGSLALILILLLSPFSSALASDPKSAQCLSYLLNQYPIAKQQISRLSKSEDPILSLENEPILGTPKYLDLGKTEVYIVQFQSGIKAVFKPAPMFWVVENKFKNMGLANPNHEEAASIMNQALGLSLVPLTIQRDVGQKHGSVQLFVNGDTLSKYQFKKLSAKQKSLLKDLYVFDYIIQNADRNLFNILVDKDHIWAIDNGSSFYLSRQITFAPIFNEVLMDSLSFEMWQKLKSVDLIKIRQSLSRLISEDRLQELEERVSKLIKYGESKFQRQIEELKIE